MVPIPEQLLWVLPDTVLLLILVLVHASFHMADRATFDRRMLLLRRDLNRPLLHPQPWMATLRTMAMLIDLMCHFRPHAL